MHHISLIQMFKLIFELKTIKQQNKNLKETKGLFIKISPLNDIIRFIKGKIAIKNQ